MKNMITTSKFNFGKHNGNVVLSFGKKEIEIEEIEYIMTIYDICGAECFEEKSVILMAISLTLQGRTGTYNNGKWEFDV